MKLAQKSIEFQNNENCQKMRRTKTTFWFNLKCFEHNTLNTSHVTHFENKIDLLILGYNRRDACIMFAHIHTSHIHFQASKKFSHSVQTASHSEYRNIEWQKLYSQEAAAHVFVLSCVFYFQFHWILMFKNLLRFLGTNATFRGIRKKKNNTQNAQCACSTCLWTINIHCRWWNFINIQYAMENNGKSKFPRHGHGQNMQTEYTNLRHCIYWMCLSILVNLLRITIDSMKMNMICSCSCSCSCSYC